MKKQILTLVFINAITAISVLLLSSCGNVNDPFEMQRLIIEEGYYTRIDTSATDEIQYHVEFTFYVIAEECYWGGYSIQLGSTARRMWLYKMSTLKPGQKYSWEQTYTLSNELVNNPVVKMLGYRVGSLESSDNLRAAYELQPL